MRNNMLCIALIIIWGTFTVDVSAQTIVTEMQIGTFISDTASPAVMMTTGRDWKIIRDTARGLIVAAKTSIVYANREDDIQGALTEALVLKTLDVFGDSKLHFGFGTVLLSDIKDGADKHSFGLDFTGGINIKRWVMVSLTGLYFPGSSGTNQGAVLFGVNLAPPF